MYVENPLFTTNQVCALLIRHVAHTTAEEPVGKENLHKRFHGIL